MYLHDKFTSLILHQYDQYSTINDQYSTINKKKSKLYLPKMKTLHFYYTNSLNIIKSVYFTMPVYNRTNNKGNT